MYRRGDPRWNRTIQHISENIEHANETAAENLYGFTTRYVSPCLASLTHCCNALTAPCFPSTDDRRRLRARSHGRAELSFDFYDDWEEDESDGLLGWGNDNLERFLGSASNYGTAAAQPGRQRAMSYGARARDPRFDAARRKSTVQSREGADPTLIPSSSYFGFLGRLPFRLGGKGLRYKPSAADLTEHPGALRRSVEEGMPLIEDSEEEEAAGHHGGGDCKTGASRHRRARSNTHNSGHTTDSFSSRGDIFPSEDELDDAVPLDDEFTIALERRTTVTGQSQLDDPSGRATTSSKQPSRSASARTASSGKKSVESPPPPHTIAEALAADDDDDDDDDDDAVPSLAQLQCEEERLRREEEAELERKRAGALLLAVQRGLLPAVGAAGPGPRGGDTQMSSVGNARGLLVRSPAGEALKTPEDVVSFPGFGRGVEGERRGGCSASEPPADGRPGGSGRGGERDEFVPARLPHFG